MKKIIIFNWKMNLPILSAWVKAVKSKQGNAELVVCPPFIYIERVIKLLKNKNIKFGAQNVFWENQGAYTGEISPTMLKNLGVEYVIIGHSERRQYLHETDEMINKKVLTSLKAGLKVILCVGEPLIIRKKGKKEAEAFVKRQLQKDLKDFPHNSALSQRNSAMIIAYEPIWSISTSGSGEIITPRDALEMIKFIKRTLNAKPYTLNPKILYGGSVNSQNIKSFIQYKEIDGALVGGASLKINEVKKIIKRFS